MIIYEMIKDYRDVNEHVATSILLFVHCEISYQNKSETMTKLAVTYLLSSSYIVYIFNFLKVSYSFFRKPTLTLSFVSFSDLFTFVVSMKEAKELFCAF